MPAPRSGWWRGLMLAAILGSLMGCSGLVGGTLYEKRYDDGRKEKIRMEKGEKWNLSTNDSPATEQPKLFFLKHESSF
jgi:hypothetical protein